MSFEPASSLYKYRPPDIDRLSDILLGNQIWASSPTDFNDPFDCYPYLNLRGSYDEAVAWIHVRMARQVLALSSDEVCKLANLVAAEGLGAINEDQDITELWRDSVRQFGLVSLSANCHSILMWSHYALNHSGVCLEFSGTTEPFKRAAEVQYQFERAEYRPLDPDRIDLMERILLRKSNIWEYEEERRYFRVGPGLVRFDPTCLTSIIFGAAARSDFIERLKLILSNREQQVVLKKARFDPQAYQLHIDPL